MRARHARYDPVASLRKQFVVAVAVLGLVFALLVAAASPGLVATFAAGVLSVPAGRRAIGLLDRAGGVCVPGTGVCVWTSS